MKLTRRYF